MSSTKHNEPAEEDVELAVTISKARRCKEKTRRVRNKQVSTHKAIKHPNVDKGLQQGQQQKKKNERRRRR